MMRKFGVLIMFLAILLITQPILGEEDVHRIIYTVENEADSEDAIYGLSLPIDNIKAPDFVEILDVSPSEPVDIDIGQKQDFIIRFKTKEIHDSGTGIIKFKLNANPDDQPVAPQFEEETILLEDTDPPEYRTGYVIPASVNAEESPAVYVGALSHDDWSGVNTDTQPRVTVGGFG